MIGDRRIDVHRIDIRILQQLAIIGVTVFHPKGIANRVQLFGRALANGVHVGVRMPLVDGDEFRAKTESDNGDIDATLTHGS
jgi:hypothetical protein